MANRDDLATVLDAEPFERFPPCAVNKLRMGKVDADLNGEALPSQTVPPFPLENNKNFKMRQAFKQSDGALTINELRWLYIEATWDSGNALIQARRAQEELDEEARGLG
jgi:hypothetical protein